MIIPPKEAFTLSHIPSLIFDIVVNCLYCEKVVRATHPRWDIIIFLEVEIIFIV